VADTDPLPLVRPMLASPGALPPPEQEQRWAFEMTWDGVRSVVYLDRGDLRVLTRNDREVAATYPELAGLAHQLRDHRRILDGEVVAFDGAGRPSFGELQARMHVRAPGRALLDRVPVSLLVFDLLHIDGTSLVGAPYDERRSVLEGLDLAGDRWAVPPAFDGQGAEALAASKAQGLAVAAGRQREITPGVGVVEGTSEAQPPGAVRIDPWPTPTRCRSSGRCSRARGPCRRPSRSSAGRSR
jgi:bifunctional non-homologous end joining protein LigD